MNDDILMKSLNRPGHAGEDSMRSNAEKMFGKEFRNPNMTPQKSNSAVEYEKPRLYKKGGHVDVDRRIKEEREAKTGNLPVSLMKRISEKNKLIDVDRRNEDERMGKTGNVGERLMERMSDKYKKGGVITDNLYIPRKSHQSKSEGEVDMYKKGGSAKVTSESRKALKHRTKSHAASAAHMIPQGKGIRTPKLNIESMSEASKMKKGGIMNKSMGGLTGSSSRSCYEKDMLGEHPSKKAPHINYESEMRGEKPVKPAKYAAGGVAKIRHGVATKAGKPIMKKTVKGK